MRKIILQRYESPCGILTIGSLENRLCLCDWTMGNLREDAYKRLKRIPGTEFAEGTSRIIESAITQLDEYFNGTRRVLEVPLLLTGTDFQIKVWQTLLTIPYGKTTTYGETARIIRKPSSIRAVANAIGANAISIFVPCHRVIGSNRSLTGYRGGLTAKHYLLSLETI